MKVLIIGICALIGCWIYYERDNVNTAIKEKRDWESKIHRELTDRAKMETEINDILKQIETFTDTTYRKSELEKFQNKRTQWISETIKAVAALKDGMKYSIAKILRNNVIWKEIR